MSLITTLKADRVTAMKNKDTVAKNILTTLLGELEGQAKRVGSDITDEMVVQSSKKFIQSNKETISVITDGEAISGLTAENTVLEQYLPKQLDEAQLREVIATMGAKHIGEVMKNLKASYNGQYDGKLASKIAKEVL